MSSELTQERLVRVAAGAIEAFPRDADKAVAMLATIVAQLAGLDDRWEAVQGPIADLRARWWAQEAQARRSFFGPPAGSQ